jgi:protein O-GlcNAc transferase
LHQQGNLPEALVNYQQALIADPDNFDALLGLGILNAQLGSFEEAVSILKKAATVQARHFAVNYNLGKALQGLKRYDEALASYDEALHVDPDDAEVYNLRGMVLKELIRYEDAIRSCDRAIALKPDYAEAYCNRGNALGSLRRFEDALVAYDQALALKRDYVEAYYKRGLALQHLQRYEDALASYDRAIALKPDYAEAYINRGIILQVLNRYADALTSYDRGIAFKPDYVDAYNNRGMVLQFLKRYADALASYDRAIALKHDHTEVYNNRGIAFLDLQRYEDALVSFDQAVALKPDYSDAYYNRGIALNHLKHHEDAFASFERAIALKPDYAEAYNNRGNILQQLKRYEEGLASYDRAIALKPNYADAHNNCGITLQHLKRYEDGLASYNRAIALKPDYAEAYNNRGNILQQLKRYEEALASYDRAIALKPNYAEAHINRGMAFLDLQRYEDALVSFDRAIALKRDYAQAYYNRGIAFNYMKRLEDALVDFNKVISLDANYPYAHGYRLAAQMHIGLWEDFDHHVKELIELVDQGIMATVPFPLLAIPVSSNILRKYASHYVAENYLPAPQALWQGERYEHARIRVGYFSADFRNHSTAYLIAELIEKHDRSRFEIFAFSFGTEQPDEMRARLVKAFDQFFDVSKQSDLDAAALARKMEIDIAIDLMGFTGNSRSGIFALRPAPIQVNYHTYAATMGAPFIDYIIADPVVIPKEDFEYYTEKVVHLPHCYVVNDSQRRIADSTPTRPALGLPETGFVFCCFNNHYKITPDVFTIWMRLLTKVAGSVLWLKGFEGNITIKRNLHREAQQRNVDPERLIFAPRLNTAEHLARHRRADLYLDTFYHGAGTTCSDALWAGLPVLTCLGNTLAGRVAASLLYAVGLPELVTHSHEEYESLALNLATNPDALAAIRRKLAHNRQTSPLFNTSLFARHIEAAYSAMWWHSQQGVAPDHIYIAP